MTIVAPVALCLLSGCFGFTAPWKKSAPKKDVPPDNYELTSTGVGRTLIPQELRTELDTAKALFDAGKFAEAEKIYHKLGQVESQWWQFGLLAPDDTDSIADPDSGSGGKKKHAKSAEKKKAKAPNAVREEALFYEAECQRSQKNYREGVDTYTKLLMDHPRTQYTQAACRGLFAIVDLWLEPTRQQMDQYQEQLQGKRWFVTPALYVHFGKDMPFLDTEGNALLALNTIRLHDIRGEMGEKALLYLGTINFFRKDYKEADFYFTQIKNEYPNSKYAAKAIKQSVICKQLVTGGSVYDCRPVEESKKLLMAAQGAYPELANDGEWIRKQLVSINIQQADRDWNIAEFYRRTGHPGAAYFYYELVRRRYPGTSYAEQAGQKMVEIRAKVEREQSKNAKPAANPPPAQPPPPAEPGLLPPAPLIAPPPQPLPPSLQK